ncbi:MAG: Fe-S cluster assembly protein SufD [Senegalia sp. (in: firmicutes)]|uniref:Fe-S cluster assembly protein SufD n=1 Tax=Senegalia sp. (in: firmicutes) TaxID=1924098 RepID=UPI003F969F83
MENLKGYNEIELPKWKRIRLKDISIPEFKEYNNLDIPKISGLNIKNMSENEDLNKYTKYLKVDEEFGVDKNLVKLTEKYSNSGVIIDLERDQKINEPIRLDFNMDSENSLVLDHNLIIANENSKATVVMNYTSNEESFHNGLTKVYAKENSHITIIKVQMMDSTSNNFDSNIAFVGRDAKVNFISVELGSKISSSSFITNLKEDKAQADLKSIYFADNEMGLDLEYTMNHFGRRCLTNIETKGALKDKSRKVFRGNLDFKKGSTRSKGVEAEYVILLDKEVKSDAIPALICGEDDVEGEHAASAGQINELKLFYLMSRGLSEKDAKKMIVEASFRPIIDLIPFEDLREKIEDNIDRRLTDEY